jgi:hypothetical protein
MVCKEQPKRLRWASVDAALRTSGVALWEGERLIGTCVVKGMSAAAWVEALQGCSGIVVEDGYSGVNRDTGMKLAWARGRISGLAEGACGATEWGRLKAAEWRRIVGVQPGASRTVAKQQARAMCAWLARDERPVAGNRWDEVRLPLTGREPEDECEAVLLGLAWLVVTERA